MAQVLRISEAASIAIHTLVILAENPERLVSTHEIAETLIVSEAHLSKVMQRLSKLGYVHSVRGPGGGFSMAKDPTGITLLELYEAMDGELENSQCLLKDKVCRKRQCAMGSLVRYVHREVREKLENTTLDQMIEKSEGKNE